MDIPRIEHANYSQKSSDQSRDWSFPIRSVTYTLLRVACQMRSRNSDWTHQTVQEGTEIYEFRGAVKLTLG